MSWKCRKCPHHGRCWAEPHCRATCDTCECPFDWTMTCAQCSNRECKRRGSKPGNPGEWLINVPTGTDKPKGDTMNDTIKAWVIRMYDDNIKEARAAIDNENAWADGAPDAETKAMHLANVETNKEYIRELELLKRETEAR